MRRSVETASRRRAAVLALGGVCATLAAGAEARPRFELRPSLTLGAAHDDNVLSSAESPESDAVARLAPRLEFVARSPRLLLRASYLQEAERFRRQRSFDSPAAARDASLALRYRGRRGLLIESVQGYRFTRAPGQLALETGLELGRVPATQVSSDERLTLGLGARVAARLAHRFVGDSVAGGPRGSSQSFEASLERRQGPGAALSLGYTLRRFGGDGPAAASHVVVLGGRLALSPQVRLTFAAGPRLRGRRVEGPEADLELRRRLEGGELALAYARSQARVVGQAGVASTEMGGLRFAHDLVGPRLRFAISPGVYQTRHPAFDATAYRLDAELVWSPARGVSLSASHQLAVVRGGPLGDVTRNLVSLRLVVETPERVSAGWGEAGARGEAE
ncbi:MAG: hypothetical protein AB7O37_13305 [Vicinamibacteria bacterium]